MGRRVHGLRGEEAAMDIEELRKHQRWRYAEAEERRRRLRIWLHFIAYLAEATMKGGSNESSIDRTFCVMR